MGCDIHMYCEYLCKDEWKSGDYFMLNPHSEEERYEVVPLYDCRNYELFGILAGVRSDLHAPIARYRGVPDDSCDTIRREETVWSMDGHSHNWLTYKEIVDRIKYDSQDIIECENHVLYYLAELMSKRMADIFWLFEINGIDDPRLMKHANEFRIVFWFDN